MQYRFRDYTLDPAGREVRHGAHRLALEPKVFQVLLYLLEHRNRMVPKAELLAQCWPETFVSESALTRCLARLRKAVQATPTVPPVIETLHRQGYRFVADVTVLCQAPAPATIDRTRPYDMPPVQEASPTVPSPLPEAAAPPALRRSAPLPTIPARQSSPAAERRQLTVMLCDIVDSATLAGQLDPEDFREVMVRYHATCTAVMQRYDGHVAQYLGDGLQVYFGWPQAHEDAARRAIYAGLALVTAIRDLGSELGQEVGVRLAVRVGIHTGLVVVGAGEGDTPYGQLAVGATPNLAATLRSLAAPDTVVISDATYHLTQGYFVCQPLEVPCLSATPELSALYQVRDVSAARGRLDVTAPRHRTPFVGREAELALLRERVTRVRQGQGQVVLLSGEAGMGKSRLVQEVRTALATDGFTAIECHGSPYYQHTALYPLSEWLQRCIQGDGDTPGPARLAHLENLVQQARLDRHESLPLLAALLQLDLPAARYPALQLTPQRQRQCTLETLLALILARAAQQPVLLIVEDLHWIDPTSLAWIGMVLDQGPTAPLFTLLTCRPTFASPWHSRTDMTLLTVPRLASSQVAQMVQWVGGDQLSAVQRQHIVTRTDGVPLFVEEVTKFVLAAQRLHGHTGTHASGSAAPEVSIPATLLDSLMARLDQLGAAKGTAQLGATIGREFPYALLQAVTPLEEDLVCQDLHHLVEAELLYQRGVGATAVYVFKHALIHEAAYASLLRRTRQQYHQRITQALETRFPETVETQPELLAHHYTEAGLRAQAVDYWQRAGQRASERSAYVEAIAHLTRGLGLLKTLPETPARLRQELALQTTLGPALTAIRGYAAPEVEQVYARAHEICEQMGETPYLFPVLRGLWGFYFVRAELQTAQALGTHLLHLAHTLHDRSHLVVASYTMGATLLHRGALLEARVHLERGTHLYAAETSQSDNTISIDHGLTCLLGTSWVLHILGYPDQALQKSRAALQLAQERGQPLGSAVALSWAARLHQFRREPHMVQALAEALIALAAAQGFALWLGLGREQRAWALLGQGHQEEGVTLLRETLAANRATGRQLTHTYQAGLLAEAYGTMGQPEAGLRLVTETLALVEKTGEYFAEAERHRISGALVLQGDRGPNPAPAEAHFSHALDIARRQQARWWDLRAAVSLSQLWQRQGKRQAARQLLAPLYGWFTEGFDTADLQEARALLEQLA